MRTKITTKGQVTIPAKIRRRLNLKPGHVLEFDEQAPFLKARKAFEIEEMRSVIGCARHGAPVTNSMDWLRESRGEVELPEDPDASGD